MLPRENGMRPQYSRRPLPDEDELVLDLEQLQESLTWSDPGDSRQQRERVSALYLTFQVDIEVGSAGERVVVSTSSILTKIQLPVKGFGEDIVTTHVSAVCISVPRQIHGLESHRERTLSTVELGQYGNREDQVMLLPTFFQLSI
ncbi:hypothetical protein KCU61_g33, partial [Aureobasidium melanogenum]